MVDGLTQNWVLKLLSLVFALILWFFVMGEQKLEVGYAVPLELKNVPAGMMVANDVPSLVDLRISGPRTILMNVKPSDLSLAIELRDLQPGVTSFKRLEERLNLPSAVKVTRLSPAVVDVRLERRKEKSVPVRIVFSGALTEGYKVASLKTDPEKVLVEGAESELKDVNEVTTEPIDVSDVRENFTLMAPLDYRGKFTTLKSDRAVEVEVQVAPLVSPKPASNKDKNSK